VRGSEASEKNITVFSGQQMHWGLACRSVYATEISITLHLHEVRYQPFVDAGPALILGRIIPSRQISDL